MTKAIGMRMLNLIFDIPMRAKPNSSGIGEAIMAAPSMGANHFIKPKWNDLAICFMVDGLSELNKSLVKRSSRK